MTSPDNPFQPGDRLGDLLVVRSLPTDPFGEKCLAEDTVRHRLVTLRRLNQAWQTMPPQALDNWTDYWQSLTHEGWLSPLNPPRIDNARLIAQPARDAVSLADYVRARGGRLTPLQWKPLLLDLLRILTDLHARASGSQTPCHGCLHPAHVLVTADERILLSDTGLALLDPETFLKNGRQSETPKKQTLPYPPFLSPRVQDGAVPTPADDSYSVGALTYFALTGHPPAGLVKPLVEFHGRTGQAWDRFVWACSGERPEVPPEAAALLTDAKALPTSDNKDRGETTVANRLLLPALILLVIFAVALVALSLREPSLPEPPVTTQPPAAKPEVVEKPAPPPPAPPAPAPAPEIDPPATVEPAPKAVKKEPSPPPPPVEELTEGTVKTLTPTVTGSTISPDIGRIRLARELNALMPDLLVLLNDEPMRVNNGIIFDIPVGTYRLRLRHPDYLPWEANVVILGGETLAIPMTMVPLPRPDAPATATAPTTAPRPAPTPRTPPATVSDQPPTTGQDWVVPGINLPMTWIAPGTFTMGHPDFRPGGVHDQEGPLTEVTLTRGFWLGTYPVTQREYAAIMGSNPSFHSNDEGTLPVEDISWLEAVVFCERLNEREKKAGRLPPGYAYALPTEAEWEYATRADTAEAVFFRASRGMMDDYAWNDMNAMETRPVGLKRPNPWGLYDIYGNVAEWTADWFSDRLPGGKVTDPLGPEEGLGKVVRGGSFNDAPGLISSAYRSRLPAESSRYFIGFRLALRPVSGEDAPAPQAVEPQGAPHAAVPPAHREHHTATPTTTTTTKGDIQILGIDIEAGVVVLSPYKEKTFEAGDQITLKREGVQPVTVQFMQITPEYMMAFILADQLWAVELQQNDWLSIVK